MSRPRSNQPLPLILHLPESKSLGELLVRGQGRKRWRKLAEARGEIALESGKEYKLRLHSILFAPRSVLDLLAGVNCELLEEIEARLAVSRSDWLDQALCGVDWVKERIEHDRACIEAELKIPGRLQFTVELFDFGSPR